VQVREQGVVVPLAMQTQCWKPGCNLARLRLSKDLGYQMGWISEALAVGIEVVRTFAVAAEEEGRRRNCTKVRVGELEHQRDLGEGRRMPKEQGPFVLHNHNHREPEPHTNTQTLHLEPPVNTPTLRCAQRVVVQGHHIPQVHPMDPPIVGPC